MSKLDEAFLKAYAKDRGGVTRGQPTVIARERSEETAERMWVDNDDRSVVRRDEAVQDVASFVGQSASGRSRGSAAPVAGPSHLPEPAPELGEAASLGEAAPAVLLFDAPHAFGGPHYQPISLNLSALDLFASPQRSEDAPVFTEGLPAASAARDSDILLSEPTARLAPDIPALAPDILAPAGEHVPASEPAAEPAPAVAFQAVWEVDRFEFDQTICELSESASPLREAGRRLQGACSEGLKILAVTSPLRGQGRSTLAVALARMVAAAGARVVLVDGDLARPSLADKLRLEVQLGWDEAIRTGLPAEEVAVHSVQDGFTVLPLIASELAEPLRPTATGTAAMLDRLREAFDLVIIDTGNIDRQAGWIPGAEQPCMIDAALVVEDARGEDPHAQQACLQRLRRCGIENVGIVENFAG